MAYKKIAECSDPHGWHMDKFTTECYFKWASEFKPDITVCLGDLYDFPELRNGASEEDMDADFELDWEMGTEFLKKAFSFSKENYLLFGNHDCRLERLLKAKKGSSRMFASRLMSDIEELCEELNAKLYRYDSRFGVLEIGDMKYVHGYACGVNAAKQHAEIYGRCVAGHVHKSGYFRLPTFDRQEAWTLPCMCDLDPGYASARKAKLAHSQGWGYGFYDTDTGHVTHYTIERDGDSFIVPQDHKVYTL